MKLQWETVENPIIIVQEEKPIDTTVDIRLNKDEDATVELISGSLPAGISIVSKNTGYIYSFTGIPEAIGETKDYGFVLRATTETEFADGYFVIRVSNSLPEFKYTDNYELEFTENNYSSHQFNIVNNDSNDRIEKISGNLPDGLILNEFGLLYGTTENVDDAKTYTFVLGIKRNDVIVDSKEVSVKIVPISSESAPVWVTDSGYIGQIDFKQTSDLFVKAYDPNDYSAMVKYEIVEQFLPDGLQLDVSTGRIKGVLLTDESYDYYFTIRVSNSKAYSDRTFYISTNVLSEEDDVKWVTEEYLDSVKVGDQCYINILAETGSTHSIVYNLSWGELPNGLSFDNGLISGEVQYQEYKDYEFIVEAYNGIKTISRVFKLPVVKGLGKNSLNCYLYINHESDSEYSSLLSMFDRESSYQTTNPLYNISNKPLIEICKVNCFDKILLKQMLDYHQPIKIVWDKTYRVEQYDGEKVMFQAFYKGIKEANSADAHITYKYTDGTSDSLFIPSIDGIRNALTEKIYVEKLDKTGVLYDKATQEVIDSSGNTFPNYMIYYDSETQSYYAKSMEEDRYLDVYAISPETGKYEQVMAAIEREEYLGDEIYGGDSDTVYKNGLKKSKNLNTNEIEYPSFTFTFDLAKFPLAAGFTPDCGLVPGIYGWMDGIPLIIDWGDNTQTVVTDGVLNSTNLKHSYEEMGVYQITITCEDPEGRFPNWGMLYGNDSNYVSLNINMAGSIISFDTCLPKLYYANGTEKLYFTGNFISCDSLTTIPEDFLKYNENVEEFMLCFALCSSLTSIPQDLFKYNVKATDFNHCFENCSSLTSIPQDLFKYNVKATDFNHCFENCSSLTNQTLYIHSDDVLNATDFGLNTGIGNIVYVPRNTVSNTTFTSANNVVWSVKLFEKNEFIDIIDGGQSETSDWEEVIDMGYGKYIVKPVRVFEENLNTGVDYVSYYVYEKGTKNLQENIMFSLGWNPSTKFIILKGKIYHVESIDNPWLYKPSLNDTQIYDTEIVLPYISDEDVVGGAKPYVQFFDINAESLDVWKTKPVDEWEPQTSYLVGDVFVYNETYYKVAKNYISATYFEDTNLKLMTNAEIAPYLQPKYFPEMTVMFAKPNTNMFAYQELNKQEKLGKYFTGREMVFFEVHFNSIYNKDIDNFSICFYNHKQKRTSEFQLI